MASGTGASLRRRLALGLSAVAAMMAASADARDVPYGLAGQPYANMGDIAPIGVRTGQYLAIPSAANGPPVDPAKGYRVEMLAPNLYMISDNAYSSMFLVHRDGVVVIDAPPPYAKHIRAAIGEVTAKPITHLVYSHSHSDHIGGATELGEVPAIVAHEETKRLLSEAADPKRPLPTATFRDEYMLDIGGERLRLAYHGYGHEPGNIFIHAPRQKVLMVVDTVFPGWMPWRRLALAQDMRGLFRNVAQIQRYDFDKFVGGHVARWGTRADVQLQLDFMNDLRSAAKAALETTRFGEELNPADAANPWAGFDNYIDRVVVQCVNSLTPEWKDRLAGFDVFIWDQCFAMEQSLRID